MADFSENVVNQLKAANKKLDVVVKNTAKVATSGAKASEEKKEAAAQEQKRTSLFEDMAKGIKSLNKSFLDSLRQSTKAGAGIKLEVTCWATARTTGSLISFVCRTTVPV
jgi:hypothetical protein